MGLLTEMEAGGHEQVAHFRDPESGLRCIIAIHETTLGPALGGTRMWPYKSEHEALVDVLRLAKAMTYKAIPGRPGPGRRQGRDHRRPAQ